MRGDLSSTVTILAETDVALARQEARRLAERLGFRRAKAYSLAIAVSELAHNLHFHAHPGGTIRIDPVAAGERVGVEVVAEDEGPGIADLGLAMRAGFSTNGGLGSGLPGARRLMDEFTIESGPRRGTRIVARSWRP